MNERLRDNGGVDTCSAVPVEFLSDEEVASYGRYNGSPSRAELERAFFLDDADRR